jgi:putative Holliday junction resolvase
MPDSVAQTQTLTDSRPLSKAEATILAFDYGQIRIGVAIGNTLTRSARPLTVLSNTSVAARFSAVERLLKEWQPAQLVVGLPCYPDGNPHAMTQNARRFGRQLHGRFGLPVVWIDERYSTVEAQTALAGRTDMLDAEAARVILQQFFDEASLMPSKDALGGTI